MARVGKRVLRPGGRELTQKLIQNLNINSADDVVEFAPGLGFTASLACARNPRTYTGVDRNQEAAALVKKNVQYRNVKIIVADASASTLPDACATKVYGEAMLTMQTLEEKKAIIREAVRILKPGGLYGIHELSLQPDHISEEIKQNLYKDLSANIRVHARPLTLAEWRQLLTDEGFKILQVNTNAMALLEFKRIIKDEGLLRTLKIMFNVLKYGELRHRILNMREVFRRHKHNMNAVAIVAQKI